MKRLDKSEIIFKIFAYVVLTIFALMCVYPLIYCLAVALSDKAAGDSSSVILWPIVNGHIGIDLVAFKAVITNKMFWLAYCNTLFLTFYGTLISMLIAITGAYALSKSRLMWGRGFNFLLTFTMWFNAGLIATYQNFKDLKIDNKYGFIFGLGFNAFNVILLRNGFKGVPSEIEEAATIDGATEFQLLTKIYIPMSKSSIATVTMFYALSRWNGYYWAALLLAKDEDKPLQVYMRDIINASDDTGIDVTNYAQNSWKFAMIVCSIIPILILYPQMQKYFAAGVNLGGVKE